MRVGVQAIADGERALRRDARRDHLVALGDGHGHGLLTNDVLARLQRADRLLGVERDRRDDIDNVNVRIVRDAIHRRVIVDTRRRKTEVLRPFLALGPRARDHTREADKLRLAQRRSELARRVVAESNQREAKLATGRRRGAAQRGPRSRQHGRAERKLTEKSAARDQAKAG